MILWIALHFVGNYARYDLQSARIRKGRGLATTSTIARKRFSPEHCMYIIRIRRETTTAQRLGRNLFGRRPANYYLERTRSSFLVYDELIRITHVAQQRRRSISPILMNKKGSTKEKMKWNRSSWVIQDRWPTSIVRHSSEGPVCRDWSRRKDQRYESRNESPGIFPGSVFLRSQEAISASCLLWIGVLSARSIVPST